MPCHVSAPIALVLLPCCKDKKIGKEVSEGSEIPGISSLRESLLKLIANTPKLADRRENRQGILNPQAPRTYARELYCGDLYKACTKALVNSHPNLQILIVSAFYGLVCLEESVSQYDLTMADRLCDGRLIYQFWKDAGLSKLLRQYIGDHNISHVWSLLPDASITPYHRVFREFWQNSGGVECRWVKVFRDDGTSVGSGSGRKRGEWLNEITSADVALLCKPAAMPNKLPKISNFRFRYEKV